MKRRKLVLLDTHAILHRAYHALPDFASAKGEPTGALYGLSTMILKVAATERPDYIVACYDLPSPTYRHEAYEDYKAHRKEADDALVSQLKRSRDVFDAFSIPAYGVPGFEADDCLGTIAEATRGIEDLDVIIASGDMDTLQLVEGTRVQVFTLKKGINDTVLYDEAAVRERFGFGPELLPDYKGLRGDPSDNIVGVAGIGEKTATSLIAAFGTIESLYEALKRDPEVVKQKAGVTDRIIRILTEGEEDAVFSKMLATIRRDAPINFTVPEKTFLEALDRDRLAALFAELDFRSLAARIPGAEAASDEGVGEEEVEEVSAEVSKEASVMAWLVDADVTNPDRDEVLRIAGTRTVEEAIPALLERVQELGLTRVWEEIEKPLMPVITRMEERGITVSREVLRTLAEDYHAKLSAIEARIHGYAGSDFNINSPKQLGEVLFDKLGLGGAKLKKTATGQRSTKESELEKMRGEHPVIEDILAYRELAKLLSVYIDPLPAMLDSEDRLHTSLRQAGTTTGRIASADPNLQNIPVKTEQGRVIRNAFIAPPGWSILAIDYSQIELRIAAILSEDPALLEIFRTGEDVHAAVASRVFSVPLDVVDKEMRRKAKVINFGILYGMGVSALKENLGGTRAEAQTFYDAYFERFSGLASYLERVKKDAARHGETRTLYGRRRPFAGMRSAIPYIRAAAERMAINAPIQGTAADITKLAMVRADAEIQNRGWQDKAALLLQVHDELLFEVRTEHLAEVASAMCTVMESVLRPEESHGVRLEVNAEAGPSWGELQDIS